VLLLCFCHKSLAQSGSIHTRLIAADAHDFIVLQVLASDTQKLVEASTRLLLVTENSAEGMAVSLKGRLSAASCIGLAWRGAQEAIDKALKAATLTSGKNGC